MKGGLKQNLLVSLQRAVSPNLFAQRKLVPAIQCLKKPHEVEKIVWATHFVQKDNFRAAS